MIGVFIDVKGLFIHDQHKAWGKREAFPIGVTMRLERR
jgi:hypothetical protein